MRVFLDTNIIIDFFAKRDKFFFPASVIMDLAMRRRIDAYASSLTFVNAWYVLKSSYKVLDSQEKLLFFANFCHITIVDEPNILEALQTTHEDFEDTVQIISAKSKRPKMTYCTK
jgi:predicted nucleic-acid-binding protein